MLSRYNLRHTTLRDVKRSLKAKVRKNAKSFGLYTESVKEKTSRYVTQFLAEEITERRFLKKSDSLVDKALQRPLKPRERSIKNSNTRELALTLVGASLSGKKENGLMSSADIKKGMRALYTNSGGELLSCFNGEPTTEVAFNKEVDTAIQQHSPASAQYHFNGNTPVKVPKTPLFFSSKLSGINVLKDWSKTLGAKPKGAHWTYNIRMLSESDFTDSPDSPAVPHSVVLRQAEKSNRYDGGNYRANLGRTYTEVKVVDPDMIMKNSPKLNFL